MIRKKIHVTGNTVIDALHLVIGKIKSDPESELEIRSTLEVEGINEKLLHSWSSNRRLILITGHRRESFGDGFFNICNAIKELSIQFPEVDFVYPVHLNPNVKQPVYEILGKDKNHSISNIYLIKPLDYLPFVYLMNKSYLVLTDSGGIQEEAPGLGKPVLVMRDTTERPEAVTAGTVLLVGTDKEKIIWEVRKLLINTDYYSTMAQAINPYGDGQACPKIAEMLKKIFKHY